MPEQLVDVEKRGVQVLHIFPVTIRDPAAETEEEAFRRWRRLLTLIPRLSDQNPCAQSRSPMDMTSQGCAASLFQAWQQWSTMAS